MASIKKAKSDDISGIFGKRVKQERTRQGISQESLAEIAGVSLDIIKRVESGMGAKIEAAYYIAVALNVPLQALFPIQEADRAARIRNARLLLDELEDNST